MTAPSHRPTESTGPAPRVTDPFGSPTQDVPRGPAVSSARGRPAAHVGTRAGRTHRWDAQRTSGALMGLVTAGALTSVTAAVLTARGVGDHALTSGVQSAAYTAALAAAMAVLVLRVGAMRSQRLPWVLMGIAAAILGSCQLALVWSQPTPGGVLVLNALQAHPELFLAGLLAYPVMYGGLLALQRHQVRGVLPSAWLDGLGAALLLAAGACAFLAPLLSDRLGLSAPSSVALVMRPLLDLLLVVCAASVSGLTGRRAGPRRLLFVGTFVVLVVADTTGVLRVTGALAPWSEGGPGVLLAAGVDLARLVVLLLLTAAASPTRGPGGVRVIRWSAIAWPAAVMAAALLLLVVDLADPVATPAVFLALAALATVGVKLVLLFREVLLLGDSRRLALSDDLTGLGNRRALRLGLVAALRAASVVTGPHRAGHASKLPAPRLPEPARPAEGSGEGVLVALLLLDLDGFKKVNDRYGHDAGDLVLQATARHLRDVLPTDALLVRLGGDEFAVLLTGEEAARAVTVASAAAAVINRTTVVSTTSTADAGGGGRARVRVTTSASVGVALHDVGLRSPQALLTGSTVRGTTTSGPFALSLLGRARPAGMSEGEALRVAGELLRRADVAMYRAKGAGGGVRVFDAADDEKAQEEAALLEDLRGVLGREGGRGPERVVDPATGPGAEGDAVPDPHGDALEVSRSQTAERGTGHLVVHYQPQVDVRTGAAVGVEALVRWHHPRLGLLTPEAFVDLAEQHDLITGLTTRVLHTAARDAVRWHRAGHRLRVAVNLSASCLSDAALLPLLDEVLTASGIEASLLVLEVTETMMMANPQQALVTSRGIRARGVQLSIDDYGTGHSSLAYLADLPATELKLDRSFTARLTTDPAIAAIVASTVDLAHRLGLRLVAEGVEDAATLAALGFAGCDETQGYLHARPASAEQVDRWLLEQGRRPEAMEVP